VAKAVTVARVASPPTVDKALQAACLEALKEWFEEYERVVCEGDVIGVEIDEEAAKLTPKQTGPMDPSDSDIRYEFSNAQTHAMDILCVQATDLLRH